MKSTIHNDDYQNIIDTIPDNSVNLAVCDPPYNTIDSKFDKEYFDVSILSKHLFRIIKPNGWFFCFAPIKFYPDIIKNNWISKFEYIWVKPRTTPMTHVTVRPAYNHEVVFAFIKNNLKKVTELYYDKKSLRLFGKKYTSRAKVTDIVSNYEKDNRPYKNGVDYTIYNDGTRQPQTVLYFPNKPTMKLIERTKHETQKPLALIQLLVKGYCPKNGMVFDPTAGSGTTALACINTNRKYICIEKNKTYFDIMEKRIKEPITMQKNNLEKWV